MAISYQRLSIPVSGGTLAAGRWGDGPAMVVASHGITANHLSFQAIAHQTVVRSGGEVCLIALDHRGRAGSAEVPGPYGLAAHSDDVVALLDHLAIERTVVVGHSMGGFVAAAIAERHPARVERLVLIDGGVPFSAPGPVEVDGDVEAAIRAVIGPALDRLDQRWPDEEAYVDFFRAHPAFQPPNRWPEAAEAYVRYDATSTAEGEIRSSVAKPAVLEDGGAIIVDPHTASAVERVDQATMLLWAPRGLLDQSPGLYHADHIETVTTELAHLEARLVPDCNHYTIAVDDGGASEVATAIIDAG